MRLLWRYVNTYRLSKPGVIDEDPTFYIMDEVGTSIMHSDQPNCIVKPFIYSPDCYEDDPKTLTFSVLWFTKEIKKDELIYRDYLQGITEKMWRSSRLLPWFNVFQEYFETEYNKFKNASLEFDALARH